MNFNFMLLISLIQLIFIKLKIPEIPNYFFICILLLLFVMNELYYIKYYLKKRENYSQKLLDKEYSKLDNDIYYYGEQYPIDEENLNDIGLRCQANKIKIIRDIQNRIKNKLSQYKSQVNSVIYGDADIKNIDKRHPNNIVKKDLELMQKINRIKCPVPCHVQNKKDCTKTIDYNTIIHDIDEIPEDSESKVYEAHKECKKITNKETCNKNSNCVYNGFARQCIYGKKKCELKQDDKDNEAYKCVQKQ